jgi:uncharacterized protein (DUF1501 family)
MKATRRQFLGAAIGAAAVPLLPRLSFARAAALAPRRDRVLVLVDLAGGNDGLNTVVPFRHDRYHELRPTLRVTKERLLPLDGEVGLREELRGLKELFDRGCLAIVQGVGYPQPDRSHFRSSDIWHSGSLLPETTPTGWIGRMCECDGIAAPARTPALMIGNDRVPLALIGTRGAAPQIDRIDALALPTGPDDGGASARADVMHALARAPAGRGKALDFLRDTARAAQESAAQIEPAAAKGKASGSYPAKPLGAALKIAAQLLAGGFDCSAYYVRQPGYDTHAFQADVHALLLKELGDSLAAFWSDVAAAGATKRVVVLVWSEFGRRVKENGSKGTDHGAAAPLFVIGDDLRDGIVGAHPSLEMADLDGGDRDGNGDVKFAADFRSVYATLLEEWIGVPQRLVLGASFEKLQLFRRSA